MSFSIESISKLALEQQEVILQSLTNVKELKPIEVDGLVFYVPEQVVGLVDSLWMQLQEKKDQLNAVQSN
tara:strand:- start:227 stop:436 length:210 start_codon:yes stop_codon:yes gene_type:complete